METKKRRYSWGHINTIDDFNKFIEENNIIKSPKDFKEKFRGGYDRAQRLSILDKLIYPEKRSDWSHLNTSVDFNKFIEENNIKSPKDFKEKFRGGYDRAYKLGILDKLIYPERQNNWSHLNTLDDFNKFIKENDIKNPRELEKIFNSVYNRARRLSFLDKLIYPERQNNWSYLNTPDDFNKFIKENDIKNPKDFKEKFGSVYTRAYKLDILDKLIYSEKRSDWSHLNTPDDFNKFIKENNIIKSPKDFKEKFGSVYDKARRLDILGKLIYPERQNNWSHLNTLDDFNKFIKENDIKNPKELEKIFKGVYTRAQRLGILGDLIYCGKKEKSYWEVDIYNIIVSISVFINPKRQVKFKDCKNKRELPFDIVFSLSNGKIIIIEIQGPRHYTREFGEEKYIPVRKNDLIKYRWAKEQNNVYLFYFARPNYHLDKNSYFHYIYTSEEELLNDIKKLI